MIKIFLLSYLSLMMLGCDAPIFSMKSNEKPRYIAPSEKTNFSCDVEFKKVDLCMSMQWLVAPSTSEEAKLEIRFLEAEGLLAKKIAYDFKMELWMPHHGHGSADVLITEENGVYHAENIWFIMPGLWELRFQLLNEGQVVDEVVVDINL